MRVGEDKTTGAREAKRINVMMADMLFSVCRLGERRRPEKKRRIYTGHVTLLRDARQNDSGGALGLCNQSMQ
jgi:hypothetical protein